jgi:hypothetical protein
MNGAGANVVDRTIMTSVERRKQKGKTMLCPSCNNFRPADNTPCPFCNAPAPAAGGAWGGQNASFVGNQDQSGFASSWGGPGADNTGWNSPSGQLPFPSASWQNPSASGVQQLTFPQQSAASDNSFWSQTLNSSEAQGSQSREQSLLPVPYQPQPSPSSLMVLPTGFPTVGPGVQPVNPLLPALPDQDQEAPVYVPPMYTKPRPIIPRYRAISGLISVLIVCSLLCAGAGYYAQVTGKLAFIEKLFGVYTPPSVASSVHRMLPVPSSQPTPGPASNVIYSVGISDAIDPKSGLVPTYVNQFTVGQTIYVSCSAKAPKAGTISVKWYTDGAYYQSSQPKALNANEGGTAYFSMAYAKPTEGKAEIYWNDQLAQTVLFVVEPSAQ